MHRSHSKSCEDFALCFHAATGGDADCICGVVERDDPYTVRIDRYGMACLIEAALISYYEAGGTDASLELAEAAANVARTAEHFQVVGWYDASADRGCLVGHMLHRAPQPQNEPELAKLGMHFFDVCEARFGSFTNFIEVV